MIKYTFISYGKQNLTFLNFIKNNFEKFAQSKKYEKLGGITIIKKIVRGVETHT